MRNFLVAVGAVAALAHGPVPSVAVAGAPVPSATRFPAATWGQVASLAGRDTTQGDLFGGSVAISGTTLIVGATRAGGGRAYVFDGGASGWRQVAELKASDSAANNDFGGSVAISGDVAVVGAPFAHSGAGRAYVFTHTADGWHQAQELAAPAPAVAGHFGQSVAVSTGTIVVSAGDCHTVGLSGTLGHNLACVYVFAQSATGWRQSAVFTPPSGGSPFSDVAISGSTIVVGASFAVGDAGRAYVFIRTAGGWRRVATLVGSATVPDDNFGGSVAISGGTIVVGAEGDCNDVACQYDLGPGRAYVFTGGISGWQQVAELTGSGTTPTDYFGVAAIAGSTVVVGAPGHNQDAGEVFVFRGGASSWHQSAVLASSDSEVGSFGGAVAVSADAIATGAPDYGAMSSGVGEGRAYVFGPNARPSTSSSAGNPGAPSGGSPGAPSAGSGGGSVRFSTVGHHLLPSPLGRAMMCQWRAIEALVDQEGPLLRVASRTSLRPVPPA